MAPQPTPLHTDPYAQAARRLQEAEERLDRAVLEVHASSAELAAARAAVARVERQGRGRETAGAPARLAYRVTELAKQLGVSADYIERAINSGELPTFKANRDSAYGARLILHRDVEAWLARGRQ